MRTAPRPFARKRSGALHLQTPSPKLSRARVAASRPDDLHVVEAAYRLGGTDKEWLDGMGQAASHSIDDGRGIGMTLARLDENLSVDATRAVGGAPGFKQAVALAVHFGGRDYLRPWLMSGPCTSLATVLDSPALRASFRNDPAAQAMFALGIVDCFSVLSIDPLHGIVAMTAYRAEAIYPTREQRFRWSRVASHMGAGLRLRRALQAAREGIAEHIDILRGSEAILEPDGKVSHAEDPAKGAREQLARAVVAMDRARASRQRREDPNAALNAWRGLVEGRWSLVEHFDTDGKRFIVARKNDAALPAPAALTLRERQVLANRARGLSLKLVAYDLGLSMSMVCRAAKEGMAKLGLVNEAELVALFFTPTSERG